MNGEAEAAVAAEDEKEAGDDSRDSCWVSLRMSILPMGGAGWKNAMAPASRYRV